MTSLLIEEIRAKSAALPFAQQQEVLAFVEFKLQQEQAAETGSQPVIEKKPAFRSVRGIMRRPLNHLEEDLQAVRREMWATFPREEPQ